MNFLSCGDVSLTRIFGVVETPEMEVLLLTINFFVDRGYPFRSAVIPTHAFVAAFIVSRLRPISVIFGGSGEPQVFPTIVGLYSVSVVYFVGWPFACHPKPDNPVRKVVFVLNSNFDSSLIIGYTGQVSDVNTFRQSFLPAQIARLLVVSKHLSYEFGRQIVVGIFMPSRHASSRFSSIIRRMISDRLTPSLLASDLSHFICGAVNTIDRWMMGMPVSTSYEWTSLGLIRSLVKVTP